MRILVIFILLAFGLQSQQTTVNGQQTLCTVPEPVEGTTLGASTSSATAYSRTVDCCPLSVDFYESQIRKADSLYKNYLPQSNFEEVKAAMEFFDSLRLSKTTDNGQRTTDFFHWWTTDNFHRSKTKSCTSDAYPRTVDRCLLSVDFSCAKAHYYHAVGLTEKDDIVGACEHYLRALEIMEDDDLIKSLRDTKTQRRKGKGLCDSAALRLCDFNKEDYEKIRFMALIYTRLGEMFYNVNYCDISIVNYKNALHFYNIIDNNLSEARSLKCIGNAYQLSNINDSALCYYNKSLKVDGEIDNKFDVEKCIAQILFHNNDRKDSAYFILKNNIKKINNENIKYSYHFTIGNMFYIDKEYDSALYYLEKSLDENLITQKIAFTTRLSSIYDSLGDYDKRAYYDNISSKLLVNNVNNEIDKSELQVLYNDYIDRKIINRELKVKKIILIVSICFVVAFVIVIILVRNKHIKLNSKLSEEIKANERRIKDSEFKYSSVVGKIKSKNIELQKKEEQIKAYQFEILELKNDIEKRKYDSVDKIKSYSQSEICVKILNEIRELAKSNKDTSELEPLSKEEFVLLFRSANMYLGILLKNLSNKYPSLKRDDLYYLCLVLINLNDKQIAALFGLTYDAIRKRRYKIASILGVNKRENLYKSIIELF